MAKSKEEIKENDEIEDEDNQLTEVDEPEDDNLGQTIPWSSYLSTQNQRTEQSNINDGDESSEEDSSNESSDDENMDIDQQDSLTESTCVSDYLKQNPTIACQNSEFEELTIDQNFVIDGSKWTAGCIYIWHGYTVSCINGGSLCNINNENKEIELIGSHSQNSLTAETEELVFG